MEKERRAKGGRRTNSILEGKGSNCALINFLDLHHSKKREVAVTFMAFECHNIKFKT
jgi:hypothetical protein